eukprot:GAHX01000541.1.p1 GENE.GAHX01000541.1~~GAHX01000541.1.p1  ORF type:complete len:431 (+),score=89.36 GAHX01000541.1:46-1338(+)
MKSRLPCELCQKDQFLKYRMLCKTCPGFFLCLNCFLEKSEVPPHSISHDMLLYPGCLPAKSTNQIDDTRTTPLTREETTALWAIDEDRFLIEGVKRLGFGNWTEISNLIKTKSASECKMRYFSRYSLRDTNNLKSNIELKKENEEFVKLLPKRLYDKRNDFGFLPYRLEFSSEVKNDTEFLLVDMGVIEHIRPVLAPKLPTGSATTKQGSINTVDILDSLKRISGKNKGGKGRGGWQGYKTRPANGIAFTEKEVKEHHKKLIDQIKANNIDIINIYNDVICERHNQKNFVFNSELFWTNTHKRKRKDKDILNLLKPFRRFVDTDEEFEGIVESYTRQRQLGETLADSVISGMGALSLLDPQNKEPLKEMEKMLGLPLKDLEQLQNKIGGLIRQGIKKMKEPEKLGSRKNFQLMEENGKYVVEIKDIKEEV